ncbi:MAG: GlxA family transcriptional regulator [Alphaproteobacteria bacterium]|nr:GlxA family transcriptional regulator [Alphaproteobacteria bacterium]
MRPATSPPTPAAPPDQAKLRVGFLLMHNFTLTAFSTFVDVLRLAGDKGDRSRPIECAWQVMAPGRRPARSSCGIAVQPSSDLVDPQRFDYVVVVGGLLQGMPPLATEIGAYLRRAAELGVTLVGVCTGSFVLCRLGLMKLRKCCVSWFHYRDFLDEFPQLVPIADRLYVIDGDRITCSGGIGVADLAARLVSGRLGGAAAQKALHILQVDRPNAEERTQPAPHAVAASDDIRVSRALLLMEQNLAEPLPIRAIAAEIDVSVRQLERVFDEQLGAGPQETYLALRLRHAQWMLKHSALPAGRIAAELGFADASHFGRSFKARHGVSPARFRRDARGRAGVPQPEADLAADRRVFGA